MDPFQSLLLVKAKLPTLDSENSEEQWMTGASLMKVIQYYPFFFPEEKDHWINL